MAKRVLRNVELMWCNFVSKDQYGNYSCKVILNEGHKEILDNWGVKYKTDAEGQTFIQLRRNKDAQGEELPAPTVVDGSMQPVNAAIIGNGSTANVQMDVYPYKAYGGGIAARLESVQILNLIPYGDDEALEPVEEADNMNQEDAPF